MTEETFLGHTQLTNTTHMIGRLLQEPVDDPEVPFEITWI